MNQTIGRRISALEAASHSANDFILILRRIESPDGQTGDRESAETLGQRFRRDPSETEEDFIQPVHDYYARAHRPPGQSAVQAIME